jgi:N-acetylneuraminate synthase
MHSLLRAAIQPKNKFDIAIIGKGSSIDSISPDAYSDKIVINANDSESIVKGDIGVFHHGWILDRFEHIPPRCQLYVTDRTLPSEVPVLAARYAGYSEERDLLIERFFDDNQLWLEHASVISCLRVANEIGKALGQQKRVFLLGFDFSMEHGFSARVENGLHGADDIYVGNLISAQERCLERLLLEKNRLNIDIVHVGNRPYSLYTVEAFNALASPLSESFPLSQVKQRPRSESHVDVVAEITTNHFGDKERLKAMIRLAKDAGADYIKLQKRNVDTFYSPETLEKSFQSPFGQTFRDYRLGLELSEADFDWVDSYCRQLGIGWFASVLDETSYEFIKSFYPELIKLPSTISEKKQYLERVGSEWEGIVAISTGMTGPEYEEFIAKHFSKAKKIYLLQCTSAYPAPECDTGIGVIRHYRDLSRQDPRIIPGYSSHDIGSLCCQLAVSAGARMIEKHVKLGGVKWAHFDEVALDLATGEFSQFVRDVRRAEAIAGSEEKSIFNSEHHKY